MPTKSQFLVEASKILAILVPTYYIGKFSYNLYAYKLRKYFGGPRQVSSLADGSRWAVVTGGSEGIGFAYAKALAKMNFNVAITCFSPTKLKHARDIILNMCPNIQVKTVVCDFTNDPAEIRKIMEEELSELDIAVLVNNAGTGYPRLLDFENVPAELITNIVKINSLALTHMCHIFIPRMAKRPYRSVVINVSSYAGGATLMPFLDVYTASKAYITSLTRSLAIEYSDKNIIIQCVFPMLVATRLSGITNPSPFVPDPDSFVDDALCTVGLLNETWGHFMHYIRQAIIPPFMMKYKAYKLKTLLDTKKVDNVAGLFCNETKHDVPFDDLKKL